MKHKTSIPWICAMLALAVMCLYKIVQLDELAASELGMNHNNSEESAVVGDDLRDLNLQLYPFTIWDYLKYGIMIYVNPQRVGDKSLVYLYEFNNSSQISDSVQSIKDSIADYEKSNLFVGIVESSSNDGAGVNWDPSRLDKFDAGGVSSSEKESHLFASTLPIPDQERKGTYWVQSEELSQFVVEQ